MNQRTQSWRHLKSTIFTWLVYAGSAASAAVLIALLAYITYRGLPVISWKFISSWPEGLEMRGGIFPTIVATFYLTILSGLIVSPIAIGGAVYLTEYQRQGRIIRLIRFAADSLASVPSIVYGIFGYAFFVVFLGLGWSMLSGALTLSLMILPVILRATEEAIMAVPRGFREASYALGATRWETIRKIVLRSAAGRIVTGIILGMGRAFGETAAVIYTAGMAINAPLFPTEGGRNMTSHLYLLAVEGISMDVAFGTAFLLCFFILLFNFAARAFARRL